MGIVDTRLGHFYEFGPFLLDAEERVLLQDRVPVPLPPKALDILFVLVEKHGHLVDKDELMKRVWPDSFVEEANLTQNVSVLRKVLGETPDQRFIETVPRRGYRFVAPVQEVDGEDRTYLIEERTRSRVIIESTRDSQALTTVGPAGHLTTTRPVPLIGYFAAYRHRRMLMTASALFITALAAAYIVIPGPKKVRSIAVLPFKISGEDSDQSFGLGLTDACIRQIGTLKKITVRPTEDVLKYVNYNPGPAAAGRKLGVDVVLVGKIWRQGERVTASVELRRVDDETRLWSHTFDEKLTDLLTKREDSIPEQVARALKIKLTPDEKKRLEQRGTEDVDAYNLYLSGRSLWSQRAFDRGNLRKALEQFKQAVSKDPEFALALAAEAESYAVLGSSGYDSPPRENLLQAEEKANAAIHLESGLAETHAALGIVELFYYWNLEEAEKQLLQALDLNPNCTTARYWYGVYLTAARRFEESIEESRKAEESDPSSAIMSTGVARALYYAEQYDLAIEQCEKTLDRFPDASQPHFLLAVCFEQKGLYPQAIEEFRRYAKGREDSPLFLASLGTVYALERNEPQANRILRELENPPKDTYVSPTYTATIYAALGNADRAFELLHAACDRDNRASEMIFLNVEPTLANLRRDPRFATLAARVKPLE